MNESRRSAVRLSLGRPGMLRFGVAKAACVVVDISPIGARVRLTPPRLVPDRVALELTLAGEELSLAARVRRAEPGTLLALVFEKTAGAALVPLINQVREREASHGIRGTVERRRSPR
jgi:hypothetical protein